MCGVCGYLNLNGEPASARVLQEMTDVIAHRGPDGEGAWIEGPVAVGHRRLAILDLSDTARQPMQTRDGRYVLSYNGEVYNFRELRRELEAAGHRFRSSGDAEVVLVAVAEWGVDAVRRFDGMFAFAVWDRHARRLLLGRDRHGVKPLYYARVGRSFVFASEAKAILANPAGRPEVDLEALVEYMTFQNFFTDRTLFKGIRMLPAGTCLELDLAKPEAARVERYWDYRFAEAEDGRSDADYAEELESLFRQAVRRQLVSDVPIGAYLSGGMDSGAITTVASQVFGHMKSFTVGFDLSSISGMELATDERRFAEHLSYLCKTEHYEMVLKAGDMERCLRRLVYHLEEPRVGQSYPNFYAAQLASKFGKVVLSGTGGDELFGGYPWRYYRAVVNDNFEQYIDKYYLYWHRLIPNTAIRQVFAPVWPDVEHVWTRDIFRDVFPKQERKMATPETYVNQSLYLEAKTFLHGLLVVEDKLSMAHSLESRVPFLDNDLADFAMALPVRYKLGNLGQVVALNENVPGPKTRRYFQKTKDGKLLLRDVMRRFMPEEVASRQKQGFSAPDASWFRGESIDYVRDTLFSRNAHIYDFLDAGACQRLLEEHLSGRVNRRLLVWSLLYLEEWLSVFFTQQTTRRMAAPRAAEGPAHGRERATYSVATP